MNLSDSESNDANDGNPALADAIQKVLSIGKNTATASIVLAKAKKNVAQGSTNKQITKKTDFEIESSKKNKQAVPESEDEDIKDSKDLEHKVDLIRKRRKRASSCIGRQKPSPLDRERERPLVKIATRGVVQLFNAVREQQKVIGQKLEEAGPSERKKEKALKSIDKKSFFEVLRGCSINKPQENDIKTEDEDENDAGVSWSVLRDDFMMGAKLKDWDKDDENHEENSKRPRKST